MCNGNFVVGVWMDRRVDQGDGEGLSKEKQSYRAGQLCK